MFVAEPEFVGIYPRRGSVEDVLCIMKYRDGKMPSQVAAVHKLLDAEVTGLYLRWYYYEQLYRTNSLRLELLNESASKFFVDLRRIQIDDLLLAIVRVTDPARSYGHDRATLGQLVNVVRICDPDLATVLSEQTESIIEMVVPLRKHRNVRLAHRDLKRFLNPSDVPVPEVPFDLIENILSVMGDVLNDCARHFGGVNMMYEFLTMSRDANALVERLKDAHVASELRDENPKDWYERAEKSKFHDA